MPEDSETESEDMSALYPGMIKPEKAKKVVSSEQSNLVKLDKSILNLPIRGLRDTKKSKPSTLGTIIGKNKAVIITNARVGGH